MQALKPNPETGYLESNAITSNIFDSDKKKKFISLAEEAILRKEFPPVYLLLDSLEIKYSTFTAHLRNDPKFAADWQNVKDRLQSLFTCELATKAVSKMGTIANLAVLKYLENGTWNERAQLIHLSDMSNEKTILNRFNDVIEGELADNSSITSTPPQQLDNH
jgi:hypothetical protein